MNKFSKKSYQVLAMVLAASIFSAYLIPPVKEARADVPVFDATNNQVLIDIRNILANIHLKEIGPYTGSGGGSGGIPGIPGLGGGIPGIGGGIPGIGGAAGGIASATSGLSLDSIAYNLANLVLRTTTNNLINWIKTGGASGNAVQTGLFVDDFALQFAREIDNAAGLFLEAYLDPAFLNTLCSPFRIPLGNLLGAQASRSRAASFDQRARCTLTDIVNNVQNFSVDFTQGGWDAWGALLEPNNNWIGSYLLGDDELERKKLQASLRTNYDLVTTLGGLLSFKECEKTPQGNSVNCRNVTPGLMVAEAAGKAFGIDINRLELADEINEVIYAALNQLISWALTGGGGFTNYNPANLPTPGNAADTIPPNAAILSPINNSSVTGIVQITTSVFDNIAVAGVTFFIDFSPIAPEVTSQPFTLNWDSSGVAPGIHTLTITARDAAGNLTTSAPVTINVQ